VGVNLAVSLVLWHSHRGELLGQWWVSLVQLNALATAAAALLWMTASRRFYGTTTPLNALPPLLTLQVTLGLAANLVLVTVGGVRLIAHPGDASPLILNVGHWVGWLALITALAAAARYLGPTLARIRLEALAVTGLASGVLAACAAGRWDHGHWLAYHVLLTACAVVGVATLAVGWLTSSDRPARNWVGGISVVVLSLALHGPGEDPTGHTWSAGAVLAVSVTAALLALWHRREWWAFGAGLALNLAVSLLLWDYHRGDSFSEWWVPLVQANVLAASAVALLWLAVRRRLVGSEQSAPLLTVQVALGLLGNAVLLIGPMSELLIHPGTIGGDVAQAGTVWGWLSLLGALAAAVWHVGQTVARGSVHVLCVLGLGLGVLAACTVGRWDTHNWLAYHTLTVAWALTAVAALAIGWLSDSRGREATPSSALPPGLLQGWATALAAMVVLLALRGVGQDPSGPVWTAGVVLVGSALAGALAVWSRLQFYVYVSGLLGCLAGTVLLNTWHQPLELVKVNALCLALASAFWVAVELTLQRTRGIDLRVGSLPFGHLAAGVAGCAVALLVGLGVSLDFTGAGVRTASPLTWAALLATALALAVCLRDPSARMPLADLYLLGLSALGLALHSLAPTPRWLAGPLLSGYVLLTAVLWSLAQRATGLGPVLRRAVLAETKVGFWLAPAQTLLACAAVGLSVWTCVYLPTVAQREMAALTTGLLLPAALLACCGREGRRPALQYVVLALGNLLAVEAGWACLDPGAPMPWLYRAGLLVAILTPMTIFYGVILARSLSAESGWARCARQTGTVLGILTVGALISVLAQEVLHFRLDLPPPADLPAALFIVAVAGAVAMMVVTAIALAVAPGLDPFGLSERGRTAYVYAAEVLLVLLFAHTRLSAPHLFHREMARYWPFAVLTIAFLGAATGELFRRLSLRVLAEPLERTGIFLPMLPVAVFWVQPTGSYATVWFLVGLLYVFLSVTRRSLGFALLAALAANVGLWLVLHQNQLAFIQHPQLWLIPLALSVLGAEHLNRDRLSKTQRNTIRYLALTAIYISSTAETFLTGLGQDAVRPAVLVGLSVLGVFVGMMLRVRAFLFLGSAFLLLGIFAVIRHAAHAAEDRGRIVWLVAGIVLGAAIFTLFAIFEKRRNEVLRLLQKLKDWE